MHDEVEEITQVAVSCRPSRANDPPDAPSVQRVGYMQLIVQMHNRLEKQDDKLAELDAKLDQIKTVQTHWQTTIAVLLWVIGTLWAIKSDLINWLTPAQ
jgi:CII-binding regulator of phage lambda lysogenization HflD